MSEVSTTTAAPSAESAVSNVAKVATEVSKPVENQTTEQAKKRVIKAYGQDIELDDEGLVRYAQKGIGAEKRFYEASKLQKEYIAKSAEIEQEKAKLNELKKQFDGDEADVLMNLIRKAQNDPNKLAKVRAKAEEFLIEQIKLEQASPEQQELAMLKKQIEQERAEKESFKKQQEEARMKAETQKYREIFSQKIMQGLEASGLPQTEWNVKHMADLQSQALKAGLDLDATQLAEMLKQDRIEHVRSLTGEISKGILEAHKTKDTQKILMMGEQLEQLAPPEFLNALRAYDMAKIYSVQPNVPKRTIEAPAPKSEDDKRAAGYKMSWDEAEAERKRVVAELERQFRSR